MNIPVAKPYFDKKEEEAVIKALRSGWVTQGPRVAEFEEIFAKFSGTKYAVATSSATTALFLSLYALGIGKGDEVLVPSLSFIASANVIMHVGAKPVFIDIDPATYNIDVAKIEAKITKRTKAILPVDQLGLPFDKKGVKKIAKKYSLLVVEDAACAIGSSYKGKNLGGAFDVACFSFHPRKVVTTGDGGMITTNSKKIADMAKMLRQQGMGTSDLKRHESNKVAHEKYPVVGFNFRLTDIQAAVGIEQFKKLPMFLAKRREIAERYNKAFSKIDLIVPPFVPKGCQPNWQSYIIRLKRNIKIGRDELMQKLLDKGISTRRGLMAIHEEKPYRKMYPNLHLPQTEAATRETICLPIYHTLKIAEQNRIIKEIAAQLK
jgi:dTDP-4-amino-4,6-dideoxygalactose transaminase